MKNIAHAIPSQSILDVFSGYLGISENRNARVLSHNSTDNKPIEFLQTDAISVEKSAFRKRIDIEILIIEDVQYIKQNAFRDCWNLKYVYLSDSVVSIASNAFANCVALQYINSNRKWKVFSEKEEFFIAKTAEAILRIKRDSIRFS